MCSPRGEIKQRPIITKPISPSKERSQVLDDHHKSKFSIQLEDPSIGRSSQNHILHPTGESKYWPIITKAISPSNGEEPSNDRSSLKANFSIQGGGTK